MNNDGIMVSVFCITYNHENYIREALEGFLMQKTNFAYEVLIHEDASTDRTAEILREYETRYPDLIKVVYEKENKYGKGIDYFYDILAPLSRGKYIALCEGDDAWIDEDKLQLQVDYMENHPECSLIGHKAFLQYPGSWRRERDERSMGYRSEGIVPYESLFFKWEIPTASFLFRKDLYMEMPQFFRDAPTGDEPLEFYLAGRGNVYFLNRVMSVYNKMAAGSWTERIIKAEYSQIVKYYKGYVDLFRGIDEYTGFERHEFFDGCIKERIRRAAGYILLNAHSYLQVGTMLRQLADACGEDWEDYILSQQKERFSFWDKDITNTYWERAKGKPVYVYGAGGLAVKFFLEIVPDDMAVNGVIVSDGQIKEKSLEGIDTMYLSEFLKNRPKDFMVIVAVNNVTAPKIIENLESAEIHEYMWVYESVYKPG